MLKLLKREFILYLKEKWIQIKEEIFMIKITNYYKFEIMRTLNLEIASNSHY